MITAGEIREIASKITLTLDSPESVKLQVKQISFAQKQLRAAKKELTAAIRNINQRASQTSADSFLSVVDELMGARRLAGQARAMKRREIQRQKIVARQPFIEVKELIDNLILEGDRLKLLAEEYLLNPEEVKARIAEEERLQEEQRRIERERVRLEQEKRRLQSEKWRKSDKAIEDFAKQCLGYLTKPQGLILLATLILLAFFINLLSR